MHPVPDPAGAVYDSGDYGRALELALEAAGYEELRREQAKRRAAGDRVQRGIGMVLKAVGLQPQGWLNDLLTRAGLWFLRRSASKYAAQGA